MAYDNKCQCWYARKWRYFLKLRKHEPRMYRPATWRALDGVTKDVNQQMQNCNEEREITLSEYIDIRVEMQ